MHTCMEALTRQHKYTFCSVLHHVVAECVGTTLVPHADLLALCAAGNNCFYFIFFLHNIFLFKKTFKYKHV